MRRELKESIELLKYIFPYKGDSWIRRCIKRLDTIHKIRKDVWYLRCMPELGDRRAFYLVEFDKKKGRYECSCYDKLSPWGERRRKEVCTHVGAVILAKLITQKRLSEKREYHNSSRK